MFLSELCRKVYGRFEPTGRRRPIGLAQSDAFIHGTIGLNASDAGLSSLTGSHRLELLDRTLWTELEPCQTV